MRELGYQVSILVPPAALCSEPLLTGDQPADRLSHPSPCLPPWARGGTQLPLPIHSPITQVRARFVERFSMGALLTGGAVVGPAIRDVSEKVSWVEKFVAAASSAATGSSAGTSTPGTASAAPGVAGGAGGAATAWSRPSDGGGGGAGVSVSRTFSLPDQPAGPSSSSFSFGRQRMSLHVGVLHYSPTLEPFPLLENSATYEPNTLDINSDEEEKRWWINILREQIPVVMEKASASEGGGELPQRRAQAFGRALGAHLDHLQSEPGCYGALGLAELFALREECLREFGFTDVYRLDKQRENVAALAVLPDLLRDLDAENLPARLLSLVEGVLAANIFDWGSQACVALYRDGTILDIYRTARLKLSKRPWAVDNFDTFAARMMRDVADPAGDRKHQHTAVEGVEVSSRVVPAPAPHRPPYRRVMMFVDNSGADVVLGMLPFARELLRLGCEVVLVANELPAINDITAPELRALLNAASDVCPIVKEAREAAIKVERATGGHVPPYPGLHPIRRSSSNLQTLLQQQQQQQQRHDDVHHAAATHSVSECNSNSDTNRPEPTGPPEVAAAAPPSADLSTRALPFCVATEAAAATAGCEAPGPEVLLSPSTSIPGAEPAVHLTAAPSSGRSPSPSSAPAWHAVAIDPRINTVCPKLYVVSNGQGSPCLDLRRVPDRLAEACVGVDLLVIEGMGRAIHTNFIAQFTCDVLKLAMIKTERLAKKLFNGTLYDCVCIFDPA
ncbi:hypothetical protein Vafri_272 [Volvox africanus]|nr:hypothetical protein Vafri_272 [Volvox africanus]